METPPSNRGKMPTTGLPGRCGLAIACAVAAALVMVVPASASTISQGSVSTTIGTTNVTPMWGPQIPKIIYDGPSGWYYAATMDGSGTQYPWIARIWKSNDGVNWTLVVTLNDWVYQPPGLTLDSGNRLWLTVPCYTGGQCYPGVTPLSGSPEQYIYLVRLRFSTQLADGSFDFSTWNDYSVRTTTAERYYRGEAMDTSRRYLLSAYSENGWGLYFSSFDTWTGSETTNQIATPGAYQAYLYPRVRPGTSPGEVWLLFNQEETPGNPDGCTGSACIFGVQLWRSTDGGVTFPDRYMVASCPDPDGTNNWCDAADLTIDPNDSPHVLFYKRINGVSHLYYWKGDPGDVTLPGNPTDLGPYDNHSQLALGGDGGYDDFVFATTQSPADNVLHILRKPAGSDTWTTESFPVSGSASIYSPNLLRPDSGSWHFQGQNIFQMLLSGEPSGSSVFSQLDFISYAAT